MLTEVDMPGYARTPKIKALIGFRPTEINWDVAMMEGKVHRRQVYGMDYWPIKDSMCALYQFYLKRAKEYDAIHRKNPTYKLCVERAENYSAKAAKVKAALDKLVFSDV